jgi:hypothetical protein
MAQSKIFVDYDAFMLHFGLLLCDKTLVAGEIHSAITFNSSSSSNVSYKVKIEDTIDFLKKHPGSLPEENLLQYEILCADYKQYSALKHKSSDLIKHLRLIEKSIDSFYLDYIAYYTKQFNSCGILHLKKFVNKQLDLYPVDPNELECNHSDFYYPMSDIVLDRFDSSSDTNLLLVTGNFGTYLTEKNFTIGSLLHPHRGKADVLKAEEVLHFPNLNSLSDNQIELLRLYLTPFSATFKEKLGSWNMQLFTTPFEENNFESFSQQFNSDIISLFPPLQTEINNHEIMRLIQTNENNQLTLHINFYVTSYEFYVNYQCQLQNVTDQTMQEVLKNKDYQEQKNNACIIIEGTIIDTTEDKVEYSAIKPEKEPEPALTKRKTLDID